MKPHDAIVVGGGLAGLTAAWSLTKQGLDVVLLEEKDRPGGNVHTVPIEGGYRVESGPHSFMGSSEYLWQLIEETELEEQTEAAGAAANNRFIFRNERLTPLPLSAWTFVTSRLLSCKAKLRLTMEPFVKNGAQPDETAWSFFVRRFGEEAATFIMSPFISGIYAGDIHSLGARAAFPKFWNFEASGGSMIRGAMKYMKDKRKRFKAEGKKLRKGLYTISGGLGGLPVHVAGKLGDKVRFGSGVQRIDRVSDLFEVQSQQGVFRARSVILAIPPQDASAVLGHLAPDTAALLDGVPVVPVSLVHWAVKAPEDAFPKGFGFLIPRVMKVRLLGTLFPSQMFSQRAPDGHHLMASYYGGALDKPLMDLDDQQLKQLLIEEHTRILGREPGELTMFSVMRVRNAIPQLVPGHTERIEGARDSLKKVPGLFLAGNYLTGVGIEHAVESGYSAAGECAELLTGGTGDQDE